MPIQKRWSKFNKVNLNNVSDREGAYELGSRGKVKYIGSSENLQRRLKEHCGDDTKRGCTQFRFKESGFFGSGKRDERKLAERYAQHNSDSPKPSLSKRLPKKKGFFDW